VAAYFCYWVVVLLALRRRRTNAEWAAVQA